MDKTVKTFMKNALFKKDINPHKYAILYASKFYRVINPYLRDIDQHSKRKYICQFYINFINYFFEYGKKQSEIAKMTSKLYRGYPRLPTGNPIVDKAFISTTDDLTVAQRFGTSIITFKTSKLPTSVPYVIIDDTIADYLFESEILLLPGTINVSPKTMKATYSPLPNLKEMCDRYQQGGTRAPNPTSKYDVADLDIPNIDLRNKIVVWYRAVQGRSPEVLDIQPLPKTHKSVDILFRTKIFPHDTYLQELRSFIPEYIDLKERKNKTESESARLHSYMTHMAIYDPKERKIDTINYGIFDEVFPEIFDMAQKPKVKSTIEKYFENNWPAL